VELNPVLAVAANFDPEYFLKLVFQPSGAWLSGLAITVYAAVIAQVLGVILGVLSALAGMARNSAFRSISGVYVWFFRGTPVLVQMALLYYGVPFLLGVDLFPRDMELGPISVRGAILAGILALGVNEGAYMSEIVRAGILSVDPGQTEAAKSLGMTYRLTMSRIVLPQALRVIVPPLGNEFNNMLKTTSLMSVIAVEELFRAANSIAAATFKPFEPLLAASVYYLLLTTAWSFIQSRIERKLGAGSIRVEQPSFGSRLLGLSRRGKARGDV
jgi:polar amino acid transport system permease protein